MTQEDKELLLMDLRARLGYNVKVKLESKPRKIIGIVGDNIIVNGVIDGKKVLNEYNIDEFDIKPYLRPMSSITEEEKNELNKRFYNIGYFFTQEPPYDYGLMVQHSDIGSIIVSEFSEVYGWLNFRHFDYRNLIEKGLALEAPEGMYKTK